MDYSKYILTPEERESVYLFTESDVHFYGTPICTNLKTHYFRMLKKNGVSFEERDELYYQLTYQPEKLGVLFPELEKHKPNVHWGIYWFELGLVQPRIELLDKCIEEVRKLIETK